MLGKAEKLKRYAIRVWYDGRGYYGFQPQRDRPTVGGEILKALTASHLALNPKESRFEAASRTDKGVSALSQTIAFNTQERFTVGRLNAHLPANIRAWAWREVPLSFSPRRAALEREYLYVAPYRGENLELMLSISRMLASSEALGLGIKPLNRLKISQTEGFLVFRLSAKAFTRGFIRRLISAILKVGSRKITFEEFCKRLKLEGLAKLGSPSAPSECLMLLRVEYGFGFNVEAKFAREIMDRFFDEACRLLAIKECLNLLGEALKA
jgi:tRNA pseudouridine38-40 synthase